VRVGVRPFEFFASRGASHVTGAGSRSLLVEQELSVSDTREASPGLGGAHGTVGGVGRNDARASFWRNGPPAQVRA
jgi:hypothetical protein